MGTFNNVYEDEQRARSYALLDFPGTYYLAFRDLPQMLGDGTHLRAMDFGCGAGRSTRFLRNLGFEAVGVDISASMLACAQRIDPSGDYRLVGDCDLSTLEPGGFDVVLAAFTFDNIPTTDQKVLALRELARRLRPG